MHQSIPKVLVVDDDETIRHHLGTFLNRYGFHALPCADAAQAITVLQTMDVDVVISDVYMPRLDGESLLGWLRSHRPHLPMVIMTARPTERLRVACMRQGVIAFLEKPVDAAQVARLLQKHIGVSSFAGDLRDLCLLEYIDTLILTRRRVVVEVVTPDNVVGRISVQDGALVHATYGDLEGEDAFFHCVQLTRGSYSTVPWEPPPHRSLSAQTDELMLEGLRLRSNWLEETWEEVRIRFRNAAWPAPPDEPT